MSRDRDAVRLRLLERVDLQLAQRWSQVWVDEDPEQVIPEHRALVDFSESERAAWIAGVLSLRGFRIETSEVVGILGGRPTRFRAEHQESHLVVGLDRVLDRLAERCGAGSMPDGWFLVDLFKDFTQGLARFRKNRVRRDQPWDAVMHVSHPAAERLSSLLDRFRVDESFLDLPEVYSCLHPVRQGFRVLWRYANLAPHPDLNLPMAFVAMNAVHLAQGYPVIVPEPADRQRLVRLISGPPPKRLVPLEIRLLDQIARACAG